MKRTIIHILSVFVVLFSTNVSWGQNTTWTGGTRAGQAFNTGTLTIDGDVTLTSAISVNDGQTLTIQLNGTLTRSGTGHVFTCETGRTVILNGNGVIQNGSGDRGGCAFITGRFIMNGGTIRNCKSRNAGNSGVAENAATMACGGALYINDGGYVEMNGGTIENCSTTYTSDKYSYTYNNIPYTYIGKGGAVFVDADNAAVYETKFIFNGGTIRNCTAGMGGGVYVHAPVTNTGTKAVFEMNGGVIENCKALYTEPNTSAYGGGGVFVSASAKGTGTFNMKKGIIRGCQTSAKGCGVFSYGTMTMVGDTTSTRIEGCFPSGWSLDDKYPSNNEGAVFGGGVFINSKYSTFTMEGGIITDNRAASGGGVMVWGNEDDGFSVFNMNGDNAYITRNHALGRKGFGNGGAVYVQSSTFNFINGTLDNNRAVRYGGAINTNQTATLNLNGTCIISNNRAQHGGGLSQEAGECAMFLTHTRIDINNNHAEGLGDVKGNGGGLFIEKGQLTISAGTIRNNTATGDGGGCSFRIVRITGDATVNITGGMISKNTALQNGGGIDIYANPGAAGDEDANGKNDVLVNFKNGSLSENKAQSGGGIHININTANSTAQMNIGTANLVPEISSNKATMSGGALALNSGTVTIENGTLRGNMAGCDASGNGGVNPEGNGGALYLGGGDFTVTGNATVTDNIAYNGGAIFVENGNVDVAEGSIMYNEGKNFGGGLFVRNTEGTEKNITFSGNGKISNNTAKHGGGVYASGKLVLNLDATIQYNSAINGGAIYLADHANIKYGVGLIRNNTAKEDPEGAAFDTAYGDVLIHGVGGGVFLAANTSLSFTDHKHLGLYNNRADNAADDIYACGNNTTVELPKVNTMELKEFDVPTEHLYWVEDYVTKDSRYADGINFLPAETVAREEGPHRYQYALRNILTVATLDDETLASYKSRYLCLSLGYELIWVTFFNQTLEDGDIATYTISYKNQDDETVLYRKIYFVGGQEEMKTVVLPAGNWFVDETEWNEWKYNPSEYTSYNDIDMTIPGPAFNNGWVEIKKDQNKYINITNSIIQVVVKKGLREAEYIKENLLKPL